MNAFTYGSTLTDAHIATACSTAYATIISGIWSSWCRLCPHHQVYKGVHSRLLGCSSFHRLDTVPISDMVVYLNVLPLFALLDLLTERVYKMLVLSAYIYLFIMISSDLVSPHFGNYIKD